MQNDNQVKKIISYIEGKIASLRDRLKQYETPMMQEMAKHSPHLQMEYTRLTVELQANEDNLLAIKTFSEVPAVEKTKPVKAKKDVREKEQKG